MWVWVGPLLCQYFQKDEIMRRQDLLLCVVPLIALIIYGYQLYRVAVFNLSPWKGGGMGMFSSIAAPANRFIKAYSVVGGVRHPIEIPDLKEETAFRTEPTDRNSKKLKAVLSAIPWISGFQDSMQSPILRTISAGALKGSGRAAIHLEGIQLELWQFAYEPDTATVRTRKIWDDPP
jgi:hypothetical protein